MATALAEIDEAEFEERYRHASVLAKSADFRTREQAEAQLAYLNRLATADLVRVGPKGYIHGWIFVGPQAAGGRVHHKEFGKGTVRRKDDTHVHVLFDSGKMRSFQHAKPKGKAGEHFVRREEHEAGAGSGLHHHLDQAHTAIREGRHADAVNHLMSAEAQSKDPKVRKKIGEMRKDLAGQLMHGSKPTGGKKPKAPKEPKAPSPEEARRIGRAASEREAADRVGRIAAERRRRNEGLATPTREYRGPLSDKEFEDRQKYVEETIGKARKTAATDVTHSKDGVWDPERDKAHREIADHLYARAAHVPNNGEAVVAGGLGGAGKTTILTKHAGIDPKNYLTVNPDDIKEELAKRGMVPEVPGHPDLSPMERSALVHEESSRIAQLLADKAYRDKKNMIWDITMSSGSSVQSRLDKLKQHGYGNVKGVFVDIPAETSVERALARYRHGVDAYHAGEGLGGRYVPPSVIRAQQTSTGRTINRQVFDGLKDQFHDWSVYDNSGDFNPQLVEAKGKVKSWRP